MAEKLVKATHKGQLKIGAIEIPCFVLEDGRRMISGRGMTKAIGMKGRGQGAIRIATHKTLKPFFPEELRVAILNPTQFDGSTLNKVSPTTGYEATMLSDVAEAILTARDNGELKTEQEKRYAIFCDALMRSLAKVGIIALVDEATGYQEVRDRLALQKILDKYLRDDLAKWAKTFPDEFYEHLFRLKGWQYRPLSVKKPSVVGHWTNDIIYSRLAPGVLKELRRRNPIQEGTGRRRHKHFQWLSDDEGHPALKEHLSNTTFLMKASPNWQIFYRALQRAAPKYGSTIELPLNGEGSED